MNHSALNWGPGASPLPRERERQSQRETSVAHGLWAGEASADPEPPALSTLRLSNMSQTAGGEQVGGQRIPIVEDAELAVLNDDGDGPAGSVDLVQVAEVVRELSGIEAGRGVSAAEKRMLARAGRMLGQGS
jgi:hypothetical protein